MVPLLNTPANARFPVVGGLHRGGGTAHHHGVVWDYAGAADACGLDSIRAVRLSASSAKDAESLVRKPRLAVDGDTRRVATMADYQANGSIA